MRAPVKTMPCGHSFQCVISGHEDCEYLCAYKARQAAKPVIEPVKQVETKCVECGKVCYGISYCGCRGWD